MAVTSRLTSLMLGIRMVRQQQDKMSSPVRLVGDAGGKSKRGVETHQREREEKPGNSGHEG
jgi:hypothetical protein